ncbi:hypothetical protein D5086_003469 [Populus alba]|uniref:Uncharacterized protein n=1 Tax=Populus alba TaxID=43335 RepID=A0ACC4D521_POPAL
MHEGERHGSTDDPGTGTGIGKDFWGVWQWWRIKWGRCWLGYGAGRNGYERPRDCGSAGWRDWSRTRQRGAAGTRFLLVMGLEEARWPTIPASGGTISRIGMPPPHFIPLGMVKYAMDCTCSPECYNQVSTMKGRSASKANDEEHSSGAQDEVSREEAHEPHRCGHGAMDPHETLMNPTFATTEPWSP